jgi:hypothetical protein
MQVNSGGSLSFTFLCFECLELSAPLLMHRTSGQIWARGGRPKYGVQQLRFTAR